MFYIIAFGCVNTPKYLFLPVPLKSVRSLQSFPESVREVTVMPRSQRLRRHRVRVVNDYGDTVSV